MREISYHELTMNPVEAFRDDWMLLTAGNRETGCNTMTIGWGHVGSLWGLPVAAAYVRPERHTKPYLDREDYFTLTWFGKDYRRELLYLGSVSGKDEPDKIEKVGFHPVYDEHSVWFEEANLVLVCRKLYADQFRPDHFYDQEIVEKNYPDLRFHFAYFGEIRKIYVQNEGSIR